MCAIWVGCLFVSYLALFFHIFFLFHVSWGVWMRNKLYTSIPISMYSTQSFHAGHKEEHRDFQFYLEEYADQSLLRCTPYSELPYYIAKTQLSEKGPRHLAGNPHIALYSFLSPFSPKFLTQDQSLTSPQFQFYIHISPTHPTFYVYNQNARRPSQRICQGTKQPTPNTQPKTPI